MTTGVNARRLLTLVVLVNLLNTMDRQVIASLLEPIRHEFQLTDSELGFLSSLAFSIAALVVAVPAGMLADRISRKTVVTVALGLWSAMTALCGAATGYVSLMLARMGVGAAEAAGAPSCLSMIADTHPQHKRAFATGIFYASGTIGAGLAVAAGGWIAQHFGWRWAFFVAAAPAVIVLPLLLRFLIEPARDATPGVPEKVGLSGAIAAFFANPYLALVVLATSLSPIGSISVLHWATSLLVRNHDLSLSQAGTIVGIATGIFVPLGQLFGGRGGDMLAARRPGAQMLFAAGGMVLGAICGAIAALSPVTTLAVSALCGAVFFFMMYLGSAFALVMDLSPPRSRVTMFAIVTVLGNLVGTGIPPFLVGVLSDAFGGEHSLSPAIAVMMLVPLVPAVIYVLLSRRLAAGSRHA